MLKSVLKYVRLVVVAAVIVAASSVGWWYTRPYRGERGTSAAGRMKEHVRVLSSQIGHRDVYAAYAGLTRARSYISDSLLSYGYQVDHQEYASLGRTVANVVAIKPGLDAALPPAIIGAHYDSCDNPGADDNASGVAALLELARVCGEISLPRTVRFVFFVNEEPPFFKTESMGSRVYTRRLKEQDEEIFGAVVLDSVGYYTDAPFSQKYPPLVGPFYPNKGNFLAVVGNFRSRGLVAGTARALKARQVPRRGLILDYFPAASFSDHWSFWEEGYRGIMITDTAFMRNPTYHRLTDTFEKLDYDVMAALTAALSDWLQDI